MFVKILFLVSLFFYSSAFAKDYVWLIGGGSDPATSQVSIEKNVIWINSLLERRLKNAEIRIYFTGGEKKTADIVQFSTMKDERLLLHLLARIFDQQEDNKKIYRKNFITNIVGSTEKKELLASLKEDFSSVGPHDRVFLIFNGHGLMEKSAGEGNVIRGWANTTISVRELEEVLGGILPEVPVKFVFPQCYSGGFVRLITPGGQDVLHLNPFLRCGFFAGSFNKQSEG